MGQTARLRLIRDRFIAGHSNCDLRRHLDSVSPETPIRDVIGRCRVWESHADPAVRRMSRPNLDPTYLAYAVADTDSNNEVTGVAVVTGLRSDHNTVVETILDGRPMEGVTCPELLEYSLRLLDATLDGGLVERISEWEPLMNPAISYTLDSRPMEGITNLERSALGVSLDSRPTEGAPCQEPLEQSVLSSSLAA